MDLVNTSLSHWLVYSRMHVYVYMGGNEYLMHIQLGGGLMVLSKQLDNSDAHWIV